MKDTNLVKALREHAEWQRGNEWETPITLGDDLVEAAARIANQNTHILALQKEIEGLRSQNEQLREAAALVTKESAELLELQSWGASTVVLGLIKSKNAPSLNKLHDLTLCVYCDNGIWSMPGRYVAITHWMPLPEPPEAKSNA